MYTLSLSDIEKPFDNIIFPGGWSFNSGFFRYNSHERGQSITRNDPFMC